MFLGARRDRECCNIFRTKNGNHYLFLSPSRAHQLEVLPEKTKITGPKVLVPREFELSSQDPPESDRRTPQAAAPAPAKAAAPAEPAVPMDDLKQKYVAAGQGQVSMFMFSLHISSNDQISEKKRRISPHPASM